MIQVKFKWISRAKFNALADKDPNTIYFIYNEHVLYKGSQEYGGIQNISYIRDEDGDYIITITNGDDTQDVLKVASSRRLTKAIEELQDDLVDHINTKATENVSAHTKLTDTIDSNNPSQVSDNIAVTPKAVVDYVTRSADNFQRYPNMMSFPIVGDVNVLYFANDTETAYTYSNGAYKVLTPSWSNIKTIRGDTNLNV